MRNRIVFWLLTFILCTTGAISGRAQTAPPPVPTTRILAIGTVPVGTNPAEVLKILPDEVRQTTDLYLAGKIDQWYSLQERMGVVFVLNATDADAAHEMLEKLPLGQAHLMNFDVMPLGPLNPLHLLEGMKPATP
jgi:hypothetical protein